MKRATVLIVVIAFGVSVEDLGAQAKKTIILIRHAEKDTSDTADNSNPGLSQTGVERTKRLTNILKKYRPGAVYSTDYRRTRETVAPIAERRKLTVRVYEANKPQELISQIMNSKTKRFVIAGHSNTIPQLANLLLKKELFKSLEDSEYGTIWLIRIKNAQVRKAEIIPY